MGTLCKFDDVRLLSLALGSNHTGSGSNEVWGCDLGKLGFVLGPEPISGTILFSTTKTMSSCSLLLMSLCSRIVRRVCVLMRAPGERASDF